MKRIVKHALALGALAVLSGTAAADITITKHNLTSTNSITNGNKTASGDSDQICVFCHTPHGSNTAAPAPLWNKALPTTTYTTYATMNSSTIDGAIADVGSVSLACLSCHDGTQAMDNMFNAPGSGAGVGDGSSGVSQNYTWSGNTVVTSGAEKGKLTGIAALGADLSNDHPIGIQYCGGGITGSGTAVSGTCNDGDFEIDSMTTKEVNGNQVFWLDRDGGGTRDKGDIILYGRADVTGPSVECASCHDPHAEAKETGAVNFMRVTTAGSQICLACHVK